MQDLETQLQIVKHAAQIQDDRRKDEIDIQSSIIEDQKAEIERLRGALSECIEDFYIVASAGYHEAMIEEANSAAVRVREVLQKGSVTDASK